MGSSTRLSASSVSRPPTITMAKGRCESEPMPCERRRRTSPSEATSMVIMMGRRRRIALAARLRAWCDRGRATG